MSQPYDPQVSDYNGAQTAMWLGLASLVCTTVGLCLCYVPFVMALPLSLAAMSIAWGTLQDPTAPPLARQMARGGFVAGLIALAYLVVLGLLIAAYIGLYVVMIVLVVAAGN